MYSLIVFPIVEFALLILSLLPIHFMGKEPPRFEFTYNDKKVEIEQIYLPAGQYFFASIDAELLLFLTKDGSSWTSVPTGYKELANQIGPLIDEYLSKKKEQE